MFTKQIVENKVISKDGTPIAFEVTGDNKPALVLVHGTGADHVRWAPVLPQLQQHFTVYAMDRRGRGASGDAPQYAIEREYEDIAALVSAIDGPVDLLGHSFGAACVLGAAPALSNLRRLVLYEPPMLPEQHGVQRNEIIERMEQSLALGDRDAVVVLMMTAMLGLPAAVVERARATPAWAGSVAAAHTLPRELRCSAAYGANPQAIQSILAPCLFLLGSASLESFKVTTQTLNAWLPDSRIVELAGQQHSAMLTAPDLFAQEVIRFLAD